MSQSIHTYQLLSRIASGADETAFKELFDHYAFRLVAFANSFLRNNELSEEVVSDVFIKVWLHRETLYTIENFTAYLFKATRNTAINYLENERRVKAEQLEDLNVDFVVDRMCPETAFISKELREAIEKAIRDLPPRCQLIYHLAKDEKMKYKDISAVLGISVKTIDNQIAIAIKKIGESISEHVDNQYIQSFLLQIFLPVRN
ncbi:MAG: RNA polymerase sigma-70 factor [Mangrovibacterium sp.]